MSSVGRYDRVARILHWAMAALVVFNLALGWGRGALPDGVPAMPIHKSIGLLILALAVFRTGWRLTHRAPPLSAVLLGAQRWLAGSVHFALYVLMLAMPLTGWIYTSSNSRPLEWFWLIDVPKFPVTSEGPVSSAAQQAHVTMALLMALLAGGHVLAALWHHWVRRDAVAGRMWGGEAGA